MRKHMRGQSGVGVKARRVEAIEAQHAALLKHRSRESERAVARAIARLEDESPEEFHRLIEAERKRAARAAPKKKKKTRSPEGSAA